ncbi:autophagy-related protein 13-like [Dysidea avara]|uniref:autophagy-related protein 13-like n=1 Tax=Dysidea avara TaxID=196820 RepID=UPI00331F6524
MVSKDKKDFDKYLKFLTIKAGQIILQSRCGDKLKSNSIPNGADWFNLSLMEDRETSEEVKRKLEGRLPTLDVPVCIEISLKTTEGESLILEVWSISLDTSNVEATVRMSHTFYPRLGLMLRSLVCISRTTPGYQLSRKKEYEMCSRLYCGTPNTNELGKGYNTLQVAQSSCTFGTIGITVHYSTNLVLPERKITSEELLVRSDHFDVDVKSKELPSSSQLPFSSSAIQDAPDSLYSNPQGNIFLQDEVDRPLVYQEDDDPSILPNYEHSLFPVQELTTTDQTKKSPLHSLPVSRPAFASNNTSSSDVNRFFEDCKHPPQLDFFSSKDGLDVQEALELLQQEDVTNLGI